MPRGKHLTEAQVAKVITLHEEGYNPPAIATRIQKSRNAVRNVLAKRGKVMPDNPLGRPRKLTERQARLIVRQATPNLFTAVQLRNVYAPDVIVRTVQRLLQNEAHLGWRKMKAAPKLTPKHRSECVSWARNFLSTTPYVRRHTVYSDEKRSNLDVPDGF